LLSEAGGQDGRLEILFLETELSAVPAESVGLDINGQTLVNGLWLAGAAAARRGENE
jgi:hypothetical protein